MVATALRPVRTTSRSIEAAIVRHESVEANKATAPATPAASQTNREAKPRGGFFATLLRSLAAFSC
jgi:hypothetical protein